MAGPCGRGPTHYTNWFMQQENKQKTQHLSEITCDMIEEYTRDIRKGNIHEASDLDKIIKKKASKDRQQY